MKPEVFSEGYFLDDALKVRSVVKIPLIYVGGLKSKEMIERVLENGFIFVQIARALIHDPGFINKLKTGEVLKSGCQSSNYCVARMYSGKMVCFQHEPGGVEEMSSRKRRAVRIPTAHSKTKLTKLNAIKQTKTNQNNQYFPIIQLKRFA